MWRFLRDIDWVAVIMIIVILFGGGIVLAKCDEHFGKEKKCCVCPCPGGDDASPNTD